MNLLTFFTAALLVFSLHTQGLAISYSAAAGSQEKKWDIEHVLMPIESRYFWDEYKIKANYAELSLSGKSTLCLKGEIWHNDLPVVGIVLGKHTLNHEELSSPSRGYLFNLPCDEENGQNDEQRNFFEWRRDHHLPTHNHLYFGAKESQYCENEHPLLTAIYGAMGELLEVLATKKRDIERA